MTSSSNTSPVGRSAVVAIVLALGLGFVVTCFVSAEPVRAFRVLLSGPLPELTWDGGWPRFGRLTRMAAVLEDTITLSLLGLAMLFGFRAKQFGMGADGQFFLAALAASWISVQTAAWFSLPLATVAAVAVGFLWGGLAGFLKARFNANEIVTTLMLNAIAIQLFRYFITYHYHDVQAGFLATPTLAPAAALASILPQTKLSVFVFILPLLVAMAWFFLARTTWGYEIRVVGEAPAFAKLSGIPVGKTVVLSLAMGGVFAGLAGLYVSHALLARLPVDLAAGIGFEGLVVALLARNDPKYVPLAAFSYAYLKAGAQAMERASDVSREVVLVIQAVIVLLVVADRLLPTLMRVWPSTWKKKESSQ